MCDALKVRLARMRAHARRMQACAPMRTLRVRLMHAGARMPTPPVEHAQALLDLYSIKKEIGTLENVKIGMVGDLLNGRTVRR